MNQVDPFEGNTIALEALKDSSFYVRIQNLVAKYGTTYYFCTKGFYHGNLKNINGIGNILTFSGHQIIVERKISYQINIFKTMSGMSP